MSHKTVYVSNDNLIEISGLFDQSFGGGYLNSAVVSATLMTTASAVVSGASSLVLSYLSGSNGDYEGILPDTASLSHTQRYNLEITADQGSDKKAFWVMPIIATFRES